jgi:hypothetical protein
MHPTTFAQAWLAQVQNLTAKEGGLLNVQNGEWKRRFTGSNAQFSAQSQSFQALAAQMVTSLLDDNVPAGDAKDVLRALRQLITLPNKQYTNFPSTLNNCLLEYINAKALWRSQITWPLPGPGVDTGGKEPDYQIDGVHLGQGCGDHIRAMAPKNSQEMTTAITKDLNEKLHTYKQQEVRVIVDVSDAEATSNIGKTAQDRPAWAALVTNAIKDVPERARLSEIDVVVDPAHPAIVWQFLKGRDYN